MLTYKKTKKGKEIKYMFEYGKLHGEILPNSENKNGNEAMK